MFDLSNGGIFPDMPVNEFDDPIMEPFTPDDDEPGGFDWQREKALQYEQNVRHKMQQMQDRKWEGIMEDGRRAEEQRHREYEKEQNDLFNQNMQIASQVGSAFGDMGRSAMDLSMSGVGFLSGTGYDKWRGGF